MKLAVICRAIARCPDKGRTHRIIHTGQYCDATMSAVFFEELNRVVTDHLSGLLCCPPSWPWTTFAKRDYTSGPA
jgi:hypothetical protein